jgi:hypothetical protein
MDRIPHELILETLKVMARVERSLAAFYGLCPDDTPDGRAFWGRLAQEEIGHAQIVQRMADIIAERPHAFEPNRAFTVAAMQTFLTYVESLIQRLRTNELPRTDQRRLLCLARDLEQSLLERKSGEIVKTTDEEFTSLLRTIVKETIAHKGAIIGRLAATPALS